MACVVVVDYTVANSK